MKAIKETNKRGLRFVMTCSRCPEQYEVFHGNRQVGYVRLRHGSLRLDFPDHGGKTLFQENYGYNDCGMFMSEQDRSDYLDKFAIIIKRKIKMEELE